MKTLLAVNDMTTLYRTREGNVIGAEDVSFTLDEGETLGLVGESGCGKTTVIRSLLRLLPSNGVVAKGQAMFLDRDLFKLKGEELRKVRWREISLISQSAMNALNPVYKVGDQIVEAIQTHENVDRKAAMRRAADLFDLVGLEPRRLSDYPHQFSGGMRQRAVIAMSLALRPKIIVADEPTTALDVIVQAQILAKIKELQEQYGIGLILVTHDMSVVAQTCDNVAVMYAGRLAEYGAIRVVFGDPLHPYTMGLQNAFPSIRGPKRELISIPGYPPSLLEPPKGCRFAERCPFAADRCQEETPPLFELPGGHRSACWFNDAAPRFRELAAVTDTWTQVAARQIQEAEARKGQPLTPGGDHSG